MGQRSRGLRGPTAARTFCVPREPGQFSEEGDGGMRHGARAALLTAAAVVIAVASACSGQPDEPQTSPLPTASESLAPTSPTPTASESPASPSPKPSPSPSPTSETDLAAKNAEAALRSYIAMSDSLRSNVEFPLERLADVATSVELDSQRRFLQSWRDKGWVLIGKTRIVELDFVDVSLDNSDPTAGRVPTARFELCYDVSNGDVVDPSGASVVSPERPTRGWTRYLVSNYQWDTDPARAWRVASSETLEREPCDAG
jgi:hypothetical protein